MADLKFAGTSGQTIARQMLILYLNTAASGTATPSWHAIGKRVSDSSMSYDWSQETNQDILGNTYTTMKKPTVTQSFDPMPLEVGDAVHEYIWNRAIRDQDAQAMATLDVLVVHTYASAGTGNAAFAERYSACAMAVTGLGGEGGGTISLPNEITLGGTRTTGSATVSEGTVTFTADT